MSVRTPIAFTDQDLIPDGTEYIDETPARPDLPPGTAMWLRGTDEQISCLEFVCPCGCGRVGAITLREGFGGKHWNWNGDTAKPTLTPSILKTTPCRWHGFLTDGVFVSC